LGLLLDFKKSLKILAVDSKPFGFFLELIEPIEKISQAFEALARTHESIKKVASPLELLLDLAKFASLGLSHSLSECTKHSNETIVRIQSDQSVVGFEV
jgi:hypothetical protein